MVPLERDRSLKSGCLESVVETTRAGEEADHLRLDGRGFGRSRLGAFVGRVTHRGAFLVDVPMSSRNRARCAAREALGSLWQIGALPGENLILGKAEWLISRRARYLLDLSLSRVRET